ncbi:MAG: radical SAM protein [Pseudomonadota bacterium]
MWPYHPELLETPVPRYTSYPTAADFGALPPHALAQAIGQASGDVSLYLHIPFCETICHYCGCNTAANGRRSRVEAYLAALHAEIATVAALLPASARVRRIAFGGGSPNAITPDDFRALIDTLAAHLPLDAPAFSIELDPRTMSADWGEVIEEVGITRASLGVQTFAKHCQKAIGREQDDALICRTIDWLRDAGVNSLNFDLMYGLPGQSEADLADSLEYSARIGADRIALFGYAHVPHIVKRQQLIDASQLPGRDARFAMARQGFDYLTQCGYDAIGFDHFALPGDPMARAMRQGTLRRNFQGFTDDPTEVLIGLGTSAISGFPGLIAQNEKNARDWRNGAMLCRLSAKVGIARSPEDLQRARLIEDLLCQGRARLSPCLLAERREALRPFIERDLATLDGLDLTITADGLPYARVIASLFDAYREASAIRFSSAI